MPLHHCNLVCKTFKARRPGYTDSKKYCCRCKVFFISNDKYCACCGTCLRYNRHNGRGLTRRGSPEYIIKIRNMAIEREHNKILLEICR